MEWFEEGHLISKYLKYTQSKQQQKVLVINILILHFIANILQTGLC